VEGGAAPFALLDYDDAHAYGAAALADIESGRMPPWKPDPACRHFRDERLMPEDEKAVVRAWVEAGMPAGAVADVPPPPDVIPRAPDLVTRPPEVYTADPSRPDDYRCFPLDAEFAHDTFVAGTQVVPGDRRTVHHVLVFVVSPAQVQKLLDLDAQEDGPGYTCLGSPGVNSGGPIAGWVPGQQPTFFEPGVATLVPAGSRLVMQVHYNTLAAPPSPDRTEFQMFTQPEAPDLVTVTRGLANLEIRIPAGEPASTFMRDFTNRSDQEWLIGGTAPHMHVLGRHIRTDIVHADGSTTCLVDIPDWDFNWQQGYLLPPDARLTVKPGESLRLTCTYDNSPAHQPVVNGERQTPRDVTWGEGTLDEMCLNFVWLLEPYAPGVAQTCGDVGSCRSRCADPESAACALDCMSTDQACAQCVLPGLLRGSGCLVAPCGAQLQAASGCLRTCFVRALSGTGGLDDCLVAECPEQRDALYACVQPVLDSGACDPALQTCNIQR
jgi:hypothetical protein